MKIGDGMAFRGIHLCYMWHSLVVFPPIGNRVVEIQRLMEEWMLSEKVNLK